MLSPSQYLSICTICFVTLLYLIWNWVFSGMKAMSVTCSSGRPAIFESWSCTCTAKSLMGWALSLEWMDSKAEVCLKQRSSFTAVEQSEHLPYAESPTCSICPLSTQDAPKNELNCATGITVACSISLMHLIDLVDDSTFGRSSIWSMVTFCFGVNNKHSLFFFFNFMMYSVNS